MKKQFLLPLIFALLFTSACSKAPGKTSAKLKLSLSGIVNITSGIGSGGALLFGRSTNGELFGKKIIGTEETLDIPNGDWVFYAFMWDSSSTMLNGKAHCAKVPAKLSGGDISLNFNLNNSNCTDPEFANSRHYTDGNGLIRFADVFLEECDDLTSAAWYCGGDNQGNALSYRVKFENFKKGPSTQFYFGGDAIVSACVPINKTSNDILNKGLPINFPSGNGVTPFVVKVEMFLGSSNCLEPEAKGKHEIVFERGVGFQAGPAAKIVESTSQCSNPLFPAPTLEAQDLCDAYMANWNAGTCGSVLPFISKFMPAAQCSSALSVAAPAIKHIVSIPKPRICDPYMGISGSIGSIPFAAGNGTPERPYKICTEWQMNQIGEAGAPDAYRNYHYKLLNNLDMNKTDFGPYAKPTCVGTSTMLERHHNLNPIVSLETSCGSANDMMSNNGFQGIFNGNFKTISNGRISVEGLEANNVGFVRKLWSGAIVKNLNFKNLEVRGREMVGGIAGTVIGNGARIMNITIDGLDVEAKQSSGGGTMVGGIAGSHGNGSFLQNIKITDAEIRGEGTVGGIVGQNYGVISKTGFEGKIDHYNSAYNNIGGIAGRSDGGGTIELSYSKGLLVANAQHVGGIVSNMSTGTLRGVYSTMAIISKYQSPDAFVGGIVGNASTNVTDAIFDGSINNQGSASVNIKSIGTVSGTGTNCYSTSSLGLGNASCVTLTYANSRNGTGVSFSTPADWVKPTGLIPRLLWEQNTCALPENLASVAAQSSSRGGATSPIVICTAEQLMDINARSVSEYYFLGEDINLMNVSPSASSLIGNFNGTLWGNGKVLYGLNVTMATNSVPDNVGLFGINNGAIRNLKLYNNFLYGLAEDTATGMITGLNKGKVVEIEGAGNSITGVNNIGGIVGQNGKSGVIDSPGEIDRVYSESGKVSGMTAVGGIVGLNQRGSVTRAASQMKIINKMSGDFSSFGGVVGANSAATIDQVSFSGEIYLNASTTNTWLRVGGITGSNYGTVSNALVKNYARIDVMNHTKVGGLVGYNGDASSVLTKSISLGRVSVNNANTALPTSPMAEVSMLAGDNIGSVTDSYFLAKNLGAFIGSWYTASPYCDGTYLYFATGHPSYLSFGNSFADLITPSNGGGGDSIINMTTIGAIPFDSQVSYSGTCDTSNTQYWSFFKSFEPSAVGKLNIADFAVLANYTAFDLAYDSGDPSTSRNTDRMYEYFLAQMENRHPTLTPPIWELDSGDGYPRLLQLDD